MYKHSKPLPADIVKFQPYPDSEDHYRGTTVLPYLEAFFNYGMDDSGMNALDRGTTASKTPLSYSPSLLLAYIWSFFFWKVQGE